MHEKSTIEVNKDDIVLIVNKDGKTQCLIPDPSGDVPACQMRGLVSLTIDILTGVEHFICSECSDSHSLGTQQKPIKVK